MGLEDEVKKLLMDVYASQQALQGQVEALEVALGSALSLLRDNQIALVTIQASLAERSVLLAASPDRSLGERDAYESTRRRLETYMAVSPGKTGHTGGGGNLN